MILNALGVQRMIRMRMRKTMKMGLLLLIRSTAIIIEKDDLPPDANNMHVKNNKNDNNEK